MSAPVRRASSVRAPALASARGERCDQGGHARRTLGRLRRSPRCAAHRRTRRDARAHATEGGDEHADVRRTSSVRAPDSRTGSPTFMPQRPRRTARPGTRTLASTPSRLPPSPALTRRASTNAQQRAGAAQRKVAMSRPASKALFVRAPASRTGSSDERLNTIRRLLTLTWPPVARS
jgi:hypothetical protein